MNLNAVYAILLREAKIFLREKERIASILISPLLFLFVMGHGMAGPQSPVPGFTYQQYIFPGIMAMVILFTSITYGLYIIWDKRLDFLKEVLAAPISRTTLFVGKSAGGMLGALIETLLLLVVGALFILPQGPLQVLLALLAAVPVSYMITNLGLTIGAKMKSMEGFGLVMSFLTWPLFWEAVSSPRVMASYRLTFGASLIAALVNVVFGLLVAWVLVRYNFPGKKFVDALVDLPFALPTAVAGISLTALLAGNGWIGQYLEPHGIQLAFNPNGVVIALIFVGLPFVVRTVQPVLEDTEKELEEAATCLGATRWQTFSRVIFPSIAPALLTGFAMAFARGVGEYGSVIFIAGNMPMVSEITPLIIISKLEQYDYAGATAVATVMLVISFILLLVINGLQAWQRKRSGGSNQ